MASQSVIIDDRLLIEELLVGLPRAARRRVRLHTTMYWYYRACRAAVLGAGGHLSGPFEQVPSEEQASAVASMLELPDSIALPEPRATVPEMVRLARIHPKLNLLNLEAAAAALTLASTVWLSPQSAAGVLPAVLDAEGIRWTTVP